MNHIEVGILTPLPSRELAQEVSESLVQSVLIPKHNPFKSLSKGGLYERTKRIV
jgi:hypothetical protein